MIKDRSSKLSKNESILRHYQAALHISNFKHNLNYTNTPKRNTNRKRKRNTIYFNILFCQSVTTNIGKKILRLIDKHFKKKGNLKKLINRNTYKVSYSCMNNIKTIISLIQFQFLIYTRKRKEILQFKNYRINSEIVELTSKKTYSQPNIINSYIKMD